MEILRHKFVDAIPDHLEQGVIYISMPRRTAIHLCVCGCGNEVITPFSPTDWRLSFDGETISLNPSIGNWEFACQSHYWITHSRIEHAGPWSDRQINGGREHDKKRKKQFYDGAQLPSPEPLAEKVLHGKTKRPWFRAVLEFFSSN